MKTSTKMASNSSEKLGFLYDEETAKPKSEDYLLGKAIDKDFERGTLGQINAVEYGKTYLFIFLRFLRFLGNPFEMQEKFT